MTILLFAGARERAGAESLTLTLPAGATVRDLRQALSAAHPALAALVQRSAFAVGSDLVDDATPLATDAVVALLPPVSGG